MKAFLSIYVDLEGVDITSEALYHFNTYLDDEKNELYERIRNHLALGPSDFGRKCKASHGIKDGREVVEPKTKKSKKPKKSGTPPDDFIPPDELPDDPVVIEAEGN